MVSLVPIPSYLFKHGVIGWNVYREACSVPVPPWQAGAVLSTAPDAWQDEAAAGAKHRPNPPSSSSDLTVGVWVMSWSTNWPHCINIRVYFSLSLRASVDAMVGNHWLLPTWTGRGRWWLQRPPWRREGRRCAESPHRPRTLAAAVSEGWVGSHQKRHLQRRVGTSP